MSKKSKPNQNIYNDIIDNFDKINLVLDELIKKQKKKKNE